MRLRSAIVAAVAVIACHRGYDPAPPGSDVVVPRTILVRGENLAAAKGAIRAHDPALTRAYAALLADADRAMRADPVTVMQKTHLPPSGDKHDFMSLAPYWWPDSTKPNGLPYVRRDGVINPDSRVDHDGLRLQQTIAWVETLALAYYFTGDTKYATRAAVHLRAWFVDPATRMNPNLRYAQAVLGVNDGRGIGIIDTRHMAQLVDAVRILERSAALSASDRAAISSWLGEYLTWLRTSTNGRDERAEKNNHGTWYDAQVAALALATGDTAFARAVLDSGAKARIATQIAVDGRLPLETDRTRPLHYSLFDLDAFTQLAEMGRHVGVDLWRYAPAGAGTLGAALHVVAPYADPEHKWPTAEVSPVEPGDFVPVLRRAAFALGDPAMTEAIGKLPRDSTRSDRFQLFYPIASISGAQDSVVEHALRFAAARLRSTATTLDPRDGYPRVTRADGSWELRPATQWTSGFFAGSLWYMFQLTRDPEWRALAERWTNGLESVKSVTTTHDLGFIVFDSFGHGYLLTGNGRYRDVVMEASRSLATRYNPRVQAIKSWDVDSVSDGRRGWRYPVIIDNLMNLEMLFWSASHGGDTAWRTIAERHALTSARVHVRADGSTAHVALFDPATGSLERTVTWQGAADGSAWSRGQAWAIHGFTAAYGRTRRPELLQAATRTADFFLAHLPADGIPYWDFSDPAIPRAPRDASAAAIAASGLFDLARRIGGERGAAYQRQAERLVDALAREYLSAGTPSASILLHATGGRPQGVEIDVGLVYADYFFVEALLRRRGMFLDH